MGSIRSNRDSFCASPACHKMLNRKWFYNLSLFYNAFDTHSPLFGWGKQATFWRRSWRATRLARRREDMDDMGGFRLVMPSHKESLWNNHNADVPFGNLTKNWATLKQLPIKDQMSKQRYIQGAWLCSDGTCLWQACFWPHWACYKQDWASYWQDWARYWRDLVWYWYWWDRWRRRKTFPTTSTTSPAYFYSHWTQAGHHQQQTQYQCSGAWIPKGICIYAGLLLRFSFPDSFIVF